ncbi:FecCD family ABC transporter permease [Paenibacillus sp. DMB20]|uniref:FecCD family ABC transporter permease n=1 Tax=Paenibacillus sp. DMB20 TaxID=1642570 RepID=UPI003FA535F5
MIYSIGLALSIGQVSVSFADAMRIVIKQILGIAPDHFDETMPAAAADIIWNIRFPRVLLAMIVGAGLALCGTVMQAFVQNPLADPYILGISSGASLGATFSIMLGIGAAGIAGNMGVAFWAFTGALVAAGAVMTLANLGGKISSAKLVLMGTVVNALCSACSNFIIYMASSSEGIRTVTFWTMGSLASAKWDNLPLIGSITAVAVFFFYHAGAGAKYDADGGRSGRDAWHEPESLSRIVYGHFFGFDGDACCHMRHYRFRRAYRSAYR